MPIKAENKALYPADWKAISRRIRHERAGNRCEVCGAPNGQLIARGHSEGPDAGTYMVATGEVYSEKTGRLLGRMKGTDFVDDGRFPKIVLTVAHIDHDPSNCDERNLLALCQKHHLAHDHEHHQANARATRRSRKAAGELFQ